jgi:uncharacterized protein involved in exopolysaccharide biosynthesis
MEKREEYDDEINLLDYLNVIKKRSNIIVIIVVVCVVATAAISVLLPKIYRSEAVIMPVNQQSEQGGMSVIAAQFGLSAPSTSNVSELINLLKSNILIEKVIKKNNLLPVFFKPEELKVMQDNMKIWNGIRTLKDVFNVNNNQKESIIELSAEFKDPKIAKDIINYMLTELTNYMSNEAKRVAETNRQYLETLIDKNADPLIRQKIYSLIAKQIEISMMSEVKENFAFKVIDPPKVPDRKIRPKILLNMVLSLITSLFAGIFIAFFMEYVENVKRKTKDVRREESETGGEGIERRTT